jgi:hypothetical protein
MRYMRIERCQLHLWTGHASMEYCCGWCNKVTTNPLCHTSLWRGDELNIIHISDSVDWVRDCNGIAMWWVTLRKFLLKLHLPACTTQVSLYWLFSSFEDTQFMWQLTIHCLFRPSPVLLVVAISGIMCVQPTMFPTLKTYKATATCAFLTCTNCETGSKLPEFSGVVVSASANQCSTKAPS